MSNFKYPHTCPKVDSLISEAKNIIFSAFEDLLKDASPLIPDEEVNRIANSYADDLYSSLEDIFEGTRQTNSDMRSAAERQIDELEDSIRDLKDEIEHSRYSESYS